MTFTEEYNILKEYMDSRNLIMNSLAPESEKCKEGLEKLQAEYAKLLSNYKKQLNDPTKKLKIMQKRLEDMF